MKKYSKIIMSFLLVPLIAVAFMCCCLEKVSAAVVQSQDLPPCHQKQTKHDEKKCDCPQVISFEALPTFTLEKFNLANNGFVHYLSSAVNPPSSVFQLSFVIDSHHDSPNLRVPDLPIYLKHSNLRL